MLAFLLLSREEEEEEERRAPHLVSPFISPLLPKKNIDGKIVGGGGGEKKKKSSPVTAAGCGKFVETFVRSHFPQKRERRQKFNLSD